MGDLAADYLSGLPPEQAAELAKVNGPGLAALRRYLGSGEAIAFLGAGASAPLYPLWEGLIGDLVEAAADRLGERQAATYRVLAKQSPEEVVELIRRDLGAGAYHEVLRQALRVRNDLESGRSWTPVQELVCRCAFKAVVTTNYDSGIVDARTRVRSAASATGFTTWEDELGLDRWRTGEVFGETELPVLLAHGHHNKPDGVVLATTEYRRAYAGKLPQVLARLLDGHLVWIGFSFADQRIAAILREIADHTGTRIDPGGAPRHVAVMAWDPDAEANDPAVLARRAEIAYGAQVVLYPAPGNDHSPLSLLLARLVDDRFPATVETPVRSESSLGARAAVGPPVVWMPTAENIEHFTGRTEELARLDRWATDPQVALIGVTAWGGAGKTALVTHWLQGAGGAGRRPGIRGVFGWSFYANPSAERWAEKLLEWAGKAFGFRVAGTGRLEAAVLYLLRAMPLLLVLDGLEVVQEGPAGDGFGRLLDGTLREVLSGACQQRHGGLVLLTSRFPFADLEIFDGASARMLDVPPFTPAEGAVLLGAVGGDWLTEDQRRALVCAVDGHALATGVLAGLLADRLPASDLATLRTELASAARTGARVGKVLEFYAGKLTEQDRYLLAAVSLFAGPVDAATVLTVAGHEVFDSRLAAWTPAMVRDAVRGRLGGLATWHPDGTISAHPLVRDTFRSLVMDAADAAVEVALTGIPAGKVTNRTDALRVVEAIELLLDADHWESANDIYMARSEKGQMWRRLPAARLGQRVATAFVATSARRAACASHLGAGNLARYLNSAGLHAMNAGDLAAAQDYLHAAADLFRDAGDKLSLTRSLVNLAECFGRLGQPGPAKHAASESLIYAEAAGDWRAIRSAHVFLGWAAGIAGDASESEEQFTAADQLNASNAPVGKHLYSLPGILWAEWLVRTGRPGPARRLTSGNVEVSRAEGWTENLARCDRLLGRMALTSGNTSAADERLTAAATYFRDGDFLTELAETLPDLAARARADRDLDAAERHVNELITIAAPRGLVPAHCAALASRACIRADHAAPSGDPDLIFQGRDAADAALRLAVRHHLAWHEHDALRAHAALDLAEGVDRGWAGKADALQARLVPPDLAPDPLATVERLVAKEGRRL